MMMTSHGQIRQPTRPLVDNKKAVTCCILLFILLGTVTLAESEAGRRNFQTPPPPPNRPKWNAILDPNEAKIPPPPPPPPKSNFESTSDTPIRPPPPPLLRRTMPTESIPSQTVKDSPAWNQLPPPPPPPRHNELPHRVKDQSEFRLQQEEESTESFQQNNIEEPGSWHRMPHSMYPSDSTNGLEPPNENRRLIDESSTETSPVHESTTDVMTESQSGEKAAEPTVRKERDMRLENGLLSPPSERMYNGQDQPHKPPSRLAPLDDTTTTTATPIQSLPQSPRDEFVGARGPHPPTTTVPGDDSTTLVSWQPTSVERTSGNVYSGPMDGHHLPPTATGIPPRGYGPSTYGRPPTHGLTGMAPPTPNQSRPSTQSYPRRAPPSGRASSSSSSSAITSTWKVLWGRVEKSLDGLAKVEDSITERAQQLLSTVTLTSPTGPKSLSLEESTRLARERSAKVTTPTKTPLTPYGTKFDVIPNKKPMELHNDLPVKQQPIATTALPKSKTVDTSSRQINWNNIMTGKMIRANGGASSPPDGQHPIPPTHPSMYMPSDPMVPPPPNQPSNESVEEQPSQLQSPLQPQVPSQLQSNNVPGSGQYVANPYVQSSHLKSPPKQPSIATDTHARSSRIPWDTSTSPSMKYSTSSTKRPNPSGVATMVRPEYDGEKSSFLAKLLDAMPSLPRIPNPMQLLRLGKKSSYQYANMDAWTADDDDEESAKRRGFFFGIFRSKSKPDSLLPGPSTKSVVKGGEALAPPLKNLLARCDGGKTPSLLLVADEMRCRTLGRYQAFFDGLCVFFVLVGIQQADGLRHVAFPLSKEDFIQSTLPTVFSAGREALFTWAPIFAGYAYLSIYAKRRLLTSRVERLVSSIGSTVEDESQYAQLYLRLAAAIRMDPSLPKRLNQAAMWQVRSVVASSRLNSFVTMVVASLIVMTVTVIGPFLTAFGQSLWELCALDEWRSWPIPWNGLMTSMRQIVESLALTLEGLSARALTSFLENPMQFAFHLSIIASSLLMTVIPNLEVQRKTNAQKDDEEEEVAMSLSESAQQFAKLGASSATRLTMLSENGSIENALERWRTNRAVPVDERSKGALLVTIRHFAYTMLAAVTSTIPIILFYLVGMASQDTISHVGLKWDSILDVSVVLFGMFMVANNAIRKVILFCQQRSTVKTFISILSNTIDEIKETNRRQTDIQFMAAVSPTAGLVVKDLWAAHTTKRAWAVRGANFQCKNGELLVLLGDDGAGKTRILTAIAESLISPPRRSLTTNKVRGFVGVGGVESGKWDKSVLKRRLGVLLSDVRTVADTASLYSGWNMEEILEPVDGLRLADVDHKLSSSEKASMLLALKITGLYSTLMPRLPSKLSTVLTANEEDLRPSALRPRSQVLSPAEWSKLILAKVLAQTIYDNENAAASTDKIENCLVGSVLLLDDPTVLLSEVEEAKILKDLRQSGAATIMATNKWATGRFADHIVVVRDGAIIESGTHNELISRGPQQSLYAAKWHAMTTQ